jgi:hypothetical protein
MFIERAAKKHDNKYDYSKVTFPAREPFEVKIGKKSGGTQPALRKAPEYDREAVITIVCSSHGQFEQRARKHIEGSGCPKCANEATARALAGRESTIVYEKNFYDNTLQLPAEVRERIIQSNAERRAAKEKCVTHTFEIHSPTHGIVQVLIDKEDWPKVAPHTWSLNKAHRGRTGHKQFYINARVPRPDLPRYVYTARNGQQRTYQRTSTLALARMIMEPPSGLIVDHINGNPHDNRKHNLRVCTYRDNNANTRKKRGDSRFKGVNRAKNKSNPWSAYIRMDGKTVNLGSYAREEDAARVYDIMALTQYGEFALINFPVEEYLNNNLEKK